MNVKLYKTYTEKQLSSLIEKSGGDFSTIELVEIKNEDLFGDFLLFNGYGFKKVFSEYQCLITPEESHKKGTFATFRSENDRSSNYFTRYRTKHGGKDSFNPVTKTGGVEAPSETKRKLKL